MTWSSTEMIFASSGNMRDSLLEKAGTELTADM
jgi:hypothetical protein